MCCSLSVAVFAEWTPATLPNEKLTPQTYNEIVDKLNHELKRRDLTAGVELVSQGEGLSLRKYQQVLSGIERLKADSEAVSAKYNDTVFGKLPMANDISSGYLVNSQEFYKIRYLLTAAQGERVHGEVEDHGAFVLVKPQREIVGVYPQGHTYSSGIYWSGVFIPSRTVRLSDYYIGKYEVTYKLWKEVYDWNRSYGKGYSFRSGRKGAYGDSRNTQDHPVTEVTWYDCIVWCNAYTEKEKGIEHCVYVYSDTNQVIKTTSGLTTSRVKYDQSKKGYRLPTEAEWEYVARFRGKDSTSSRKYGYDYLLNGDEFSGGCWFVGNSGDNTHPVREISANYARIYDMSGNVWEWCYDGWQNPLPTGTQIDPIGGDGSRRVMRGGGWANNSNACVVGFRYHEEAEHVDSWFSGSIYGWELGLRLAYSQ